MLSTIGLGHALSLRVVAEGVETEEAFRALAALGCDVAQGYMITRALPLEACESWRQQRRQHSH